MRKSTKKKQRKAKKKVVKKKATTVAAKKKDAVVVAEVRAENTRAESLAILNEKIAGRCPKYIELCLAAEEKSYDEFSKMRVALFNKCDELAAAFNEVFDTENNINQYATYLSMTDVDNLFCDSVYSPDLDEDKTEPEIKYCTAIDFTFPDGKLLIREQLEKSMIENKITRHGIMILVLNRMKAALFQKDAASLIGNNFTPEYWDGTVPYSFLLEHSKCINAFPSYVDKNIEKNPYLIYVDKGSMVEVNSSSMDSLYSNRGDITEVNYIHMKILHEIYVSCGATITATIYLVTLRYSARRNWQDILAASTTPLNLEGLRSFTNGYLFIASMCSVAEMRSKNNILAYLIELGAKTMVTATSMLAGMIINKRAECFKFGNNRAQNIYENLIKMIPKLLESKRTFPSLKETDETKVVKGLKRNVFATLFLTNKNQWLFLDPLKALRLESFGGSFQKMYYHEYTNTLMVGIHFKLLNNLYAKLLKTGNVESAKGRVVNSEMVPLIEISRLWGTYEQFAQWKEKPENKDKTLHDLGQIGTTPNNLSKADLSVWRGLILRNNKFVKLIGRFERIADEIKKRGIAFDTKVPTQTIGQIASLMKYDGVKDEYVASICANLDLSQSSMIEYQDYFETAQVKSAESFPNIEFNGKEVGLSDKWVIQKMHAYDKRHLMFGVYTECCQHLHGAASTCSKETFENMYSSVYSIEYQGELVAGAWAWRADDDETVIFDSLEYKNCDWKDDLAKIWVHLADRLMGKFGIKRAVLAISSYGMQDGFAKFPLSQNNEAYKYKNSSYNGYMDYSQGNGCHILAAEDLDKKRRKVLDKAVKAIMDKK